MQKAHQNYGFLESAIIDCLIEKIICTRLLKNAPIKELVKFWRLARDKRRFYGNRQTTKNQQS